MPIKTFRGLIPDGGQDTIVLHTNNGSTGYKITKLQMMPEDIGASNMQGLIKIYSVKQTTLITGSAKADFNDQTLLAAGWLDITAAAGGDAAANIVFDNMTINQDIFVTFTDNGASASCNYYIELEQVKLDLSENTVATLKDIRNLA